MDNLKKTCCVLVVSCDNYSDLWEPFFELFRRFWPDCSFPVYLLTNKMKPEIRNLTVLSVGEDISWSDNLLKALTLIPEDHVLLFIDDLFLYDCVNTAAIQQIVTFVVNNDANCVIMDPHMKPDYPQNEIMGVLSKGAIYRTSTVLPIWRKSTLSELLVPGESAWDFEIRGSIRSDAYDGFYCSRHSILPIMNCVIKGKWQRGFVKKVESLGMTVNLTRRPIMTLKETAVFFFKKQRTKLLKLCPAKYRRKIKDWVTGGRYVYRIE